MRKLSLLAILVSTSYACAAPPQYENVGEQDDAFRIGVPGPVLPSLPGAAVTIQRVTPIQPGWLRVTVGYERLPASSTFRAYTTCLHGYDNRFAVTTAYVDAPKKKAYLDLRVDYRLPGADFDPCSIRKLRVAAVGSAGTELAFTESNDRIDTEYDAAHHYGGSVVRTFGNIEQDSVDLALPASARRYAAYPPVTFAVMSATGRVAIAEVEELPARGTVGLRWMTVFADLGDKSAEREIGGGAEMDDGYGIDVDGRGITKVTSGVEHSNPGHRTFGTGPWQASFMTDWSKKVLPAPPRHSEGTYLAEVLDNRGLPRELDPADALDVIYDKAAHKLVAANGAKLRRMEHASQNTIIPAQYTFVVPRPVLKVSVNNGAAAQPKIAADIAEAHLALAGQLGLVTPPRGLVETRAYVAAMAAAPLEGTAANHLPVPRPPRATSPQEARISGEPYVPEDAGQGPNGQMQPNVPAMPNGVLRSAPLAQTAPPLPIPNNIRPHGFAPSGVVPNIPVIPPPDMTASCVLSADATTFTSPPTMCDGFTGASGCPTAANPMPLATMAQFPGALREVSVTSIMTPLRAGRANTKGTCGTHADNQAFEAALNRVHDDIGPARVALVDGLPIGIPEPRIAFSHAANLSHLYSWMGTKGDEPNWMTPTAGWPATAEYLAFPQVPEGIWPTFEDTTAAWASPDHVGMFVPVSSDPGLSLWTCQKQYWRSAFCTGQGTDPPGVYRSYSRMSHDAAVSADPLRDGVFSLANSYNPWQRHDISLADPDQAITDVIGQLRGGMPVRLDYTTALEAKDVTPKPRPLFAKDDITWYLPKELAGCNLTDKYKRTGGHAVNIVGVVLRGAPSNPDPYRSFFVLENNWGKGSIDSLLGHNAINFAAFKLLANAVYTYHLARPCDSWACQR